MCAHTREDLFMVIDSLRYDLFGATANNSTASNSWKLLSPPLSPSLAPGSNTGGTLSRADLAECLRHKRLPPHSLSLAGPLHLFLGSFFMAHSRALAYSRQGTCFARICFYGSSVRQSNRKQLGPLPKKFSAKNKTAVSAQPENTGGNSKHDGQL